MVCRVATRRLSVVGGRDGCRRLFWPRLDTQFGHSVPDFGLCVAGALFCPVAGNQTARSLAGAGCRGSGDAAWAVLAACLCSHSAGHVGGRLAGGAFMNGADLFWIIALSGAEIGRASWRERVCQYVLVSVVAVSLKKKQQ